MPIIAHVTTVHAPDDSRIFVRELSSLKDKYTCVLIAPSKPGFEPQGIHYIPVSKHKSRLLRFIHGGGYSFVNILKIKPHLIHFHDPEWLPFACVLSLLGYKLIFDVHENNIADIKFRNKSIIKKNILIFILRFFYRIYQSKQYFIFVANEEISIPENIPSNKFIRVLNYSNKWDTHVKKYNDDENKNLKLIYIGLIQDYYYDIIPLLNAIEIVNKDGIVINFKIAGKKGIYFNEIEHLIIGDSKVRGVEYLGDLINEDLNPLLNWADIGICLKNQTNESVWSVERKLYEYLSAGLPFICSDRNLYSDICILTKAGVPIDITATENWLNILNNCMTNHAFLMKLKEQAELHKSTFIWDTEAKKIVDFYNKVLHA